MELPNLAMWNAGAEHDAETFNELSYALSFVLSPPECCVRQTSAQSLAPGGVRAISFSGADRDNDGMWDAGTPTLITIQTSGWYELEWAVSFATRSDSTSRATSIYLNGNLTSDAAYCYYNYFDVSSSTPQLWQTYDLFLNAGDTVHLGASHGSATALNTASSSTLADQQTFLRARWASL